MGGEADLVVDDHVDGAADPKAARLRHLEGLHHHALARERGIAMDEQRRYAVAIRVCAPILPSPHGARHHWADDLQMGRIEGEGHVYFAARRHHVGGKALVVLDVARAVRIRHHALELVEQFAGVLAEDVHQHVQPAAVCHADHRFHAAASAQTVAAPRATCRSGSPRPPGRSAWCRESGRASAAPCLLLRSADRGW